MLPTTISSSVLSEGMLPAVRLQESAGGLRRAAAMTTLQGNRTTC